MLRLGLVVFLVLGTAAAEVVNCGFEPCPLDNKDPIVVAVPSDCRLYVTCISGKPIFGYCPDNSMFDDETKKCLPGGSAHCKTCYAGNAKAKTLKDELIRMLNEDMPVPKDTKPSNLLKNNISQRCIDNSVTPVTCPAEMDDDRLLPHPDDCHLFYYCIHMDLAPICRDCPANLHFNPVKKVCDHPEVAGCRSYGFQLFSRITPERAALTCDNVNGEIADLQPDPEDCSKYYVCDWGVLIHMSCPSGLMFDAPRKICLTVEDAVCFDDGALVTTPLPTEAPVEPPVKCETTINEDEVELHPDPESCEFFYICSWGIPHKTSCPPGQHFNPNLLVCDWPETAQCEVGYFMKK